MLSLKNTYKGLKRDAEIGLAIASAGLKNTYKGLKPEAQKYLDWGVVSFEEYL